MRSFFAVLLLCLVPALAHAETCIASVYSTRDHDQNGTKTASGIPLNDRIASMAHKTRPLRSYATVTNLRSGKAVPLLVSDRGPYITGRCVDLSRAAAVRLGCNGLCFVSVH